MAASAALVADLGGIGGGVTARLVSVTLDSSYPTGGEALTADTLGVGKIVRVLPFASAGLVPEWDNTNAKLIMYWVDTSTDGAALAEVAAETDLATVSILCLVLGRP